MMLKRAIDKSAEPTCMLAVKVSYGPEPIWAAMMQLTQRNNAFAVRDLVVRLDIGPEVIRDYLRRCLAGGYIVEAGVSDTRAQLYAVAVPSASAPRLMANGKPLTRALIADHLWRALKMLRGEPVTARRLALLASTDELSIPEASARRYLLALEAAGYIKPHGSKRGPQGQFRLMPHMNTGPMPPCLQRATFVYDFNRREIVGAAVAEEVSL